MLTLGRRARHSSLAGRAENGASPTRSRRPATSSPRVSGSKCPPPRAIDQRRSFTTPRRRPYEAAVVGAGPAGITCVGNLLERKLTPILWIDDEFDGGRVNRRYREVPSNTKTKTFIDWATGVTPFQKIVSGQGGADKLWAMRQLDQEKGCRLSHAADACLMLTEGLQTFPGVDARFGTLEEGMLADEGTPQGRWSLQFDDGLSKHTVRSHRLVLCTGASPNNGALPIDAPGVAHLDLDTALSPTRLSAALSHRDAVTVSVIGASHSAILVLMNIYHLASTSKPRLRVRWFTRHPLRYAVFMDGWILRDNTGLKGAAADWARENLEPDVFEHRDVSTYIRRIAYAADHETHTLRHHLPGSDYYVAATGFTRDPIPTLRTPKGEPMQPLFDHERGSFAYVEGGRRVPGLFGAGIAFPERVRDPHGNVEMAVGFFKFMKFVKRVSPQWN